MRLSILVLLCLAVFLPIHPMQQPTPAETVYLLKPAHVFDGESAQVHDNWVVLVRGEKIEAVGPAGSVTTPTGAKVIDLPGLTLMPGLIEARRPDLVLIGDGDPALGDAEYLKKVGWKSTTLFEW